MPIFVFPRGRSDATLSPAHAAFGRAITRLRVHHFTSCDELAQLLDMDVDALERIERGETVPSLQELLDICDALCEPLSRLVALFENDAFMPVPLTEHPRTFREPEPQYGSSLEQMAVRASRSVGRLFAPRRRLPRRPAGVPRARGRCAAPQA